MIRDFFTSTDFRVIAGPCVIEDYDTAYKIAEAVKKTGVSLFRAGAFKMRTDPDSFQGLGLEGVTIISKVCKKLGLISVTEVTSAQDLHFISRNIDILVVGTRNMQNYPLLSEIGKLKNPVILKRGMACTIKEWLLALEYIKKSGNHNVILCERGIRTFETSTRNTLDISAIPVLRTLCDNPIIIDPSHSTGNRNFVKSVSFAAAAAGADGLLIEVHINPEHSICDSQQIIDIQELVEIMAGTEKIIKVWGKNMAIT